MSGLTITNLAQQVQDLLDKTRQQNTNLAAWLGGAADGGPNNDGLYPFVDLTGREILVPAPAKLADTATGPAAQAVTAMLAAQASEQKADASATRADEQRTLAQAARGAAVEARDLAQQHRNHAGTSEANARHWAELAQSKGEGSSEDRAVVEQLASEVADNAALTAQDAQAAAASAALAATFDPNLFDRKSDTLSSSRLTGVIDISLIPVLPSQKQFASSGGLANLTTAQQAEIGQGSVVTTTDGYRYIYSGQGSKTAAASYTILADITPEWNSVAGKPSFFPSNITNVAGLQSALDLKSAIGHAHAWSEITGKPNLYPTDIASVSGLQAALNDKSAVGHGHSWTEITGKPTTFAPSSHGHAWAEITGKPTTFAPSAHGHAFSEITGFNGFDNKGEIPTAADINTYTTSGLYHQPNNARAAAGTNYPIPEAGMLEVFASGQMIYQRYTNYRNNRTWWRTWNTVGWTAWAEVGQRDAVRPSDAITDFNATPYIHGMRMIHASGTAANRPGTGAWQQGFELARAGVRPVQMVFSDGLSPDLFFRKKNGATDADWSPWHTIWNSGNLNPADYVSRTATGKQTMAAPLSVKDRLNLTGPDPYVGSEGTARSLVVAGGGGWTSTGSVIALFGNTHAAQSGSVIIQAGDVGNRQLNIAGFQSIYMNVRPTFGGNTPWDSGNFNPTTKQNRVEDVQSLELGAGLTGNRAAYIDFHAAGNAATADFHARINRLAGVNGIFVFENLGTGGLQFSAAGNAPTNFYGGGVSFYQEIASTGNLKIINTGPTIRLTDTDHRSAMIHVNSNRFYILRGAGVGSDAWESLPTGWPLEIDLNNGETQFSGEVYAGSEKWFRVRGNSGIYWQNHDGGWFMNDASWMRSYNNKSIVTGGTVQMGAFTVTSDRRLKTDITPIPQTEAARIIDATNVYEFTKSGKRMFGMIAQEAREIAPILVSHSADLHPEDGDPILSLDQTGYIPLLIAEVRSLRQRVSTLERSAA